MSSADEWLQGRMDVAQRQAYIQRLGRNPEAADQLVMAAILEQDLRLVYAEDSNAGGAQQLRWRPLAMASAALAASLVCALWLLQPEAARPRAVQTEAETVTVSWQPGASLTLDAHSRVEPAADGWPIVRSGSVQLQVSSGHTGSIGLRDERIEAAVTGTVLTLTRGNQASLLQVQSGEVYAQADDWRGKLVSGQWLWAAEQAIVGHGLAPGVAARELNQKDPRSTPVGLQERVFWQAGEMSITTGVISQQQVAGPYRPFAGYAWNLQHTAWRWHGDIAIVDGDLNQAALRARRGDGHIPWRLTISQRGVQVGQDYPSYAVLAAAEWPSDYADGSSYPVWVQVDGSGLQVGIAGETLIRLTPDQIDAAASQLEILAQGHASQDQGQVFYRQMLLTPLSE